MMKGTISFTLVFAVLCVTVFGCSRETPDTRPPHSDEAAGRQDRADAAQRDATEEQSAGAQHSVDVGSERAIESNLAEKSLEELLLAFRIDGAFTYGQQDERFRYIDQQDPADLASAVEQNQSIMDELRRRRQSLSKKTLLKYRECHLSIYTGPSGQYRTVANFCRMLLGEPDYQDGYTVPDDEGAERDETR